MKGDKLYTKNIRILSESVQLKRAMTADSGSVEEFAKKYDLPYSMKSIQSYLDHATPQSDKIGGHIMAALRKPYNAIVKSPLRQIEDYADRINDNIERYFLKSDLRVVDKLMEMAEEIGGNNADVKAKLYRAMGMMYFFMNQIAAAEEYIEKARGVARERLGFDLYVLCSVDMANLSDCMLKYNEAERTILMAQRYIDYDEVKEKTRYYYHYIYGNIMFDVEEYGKAREHYEQAVGYAQRDVDRARMFLNIGGAFRKLMQIDKALESYDKAYNAYDENDKVGISSTYNNRAEALRQIGKLDEAQVNAQKAIELIGNASTNLRIAYTFTHIQIRIDKGEYEAVDDIFNLIKPANKAFFYRVNIIQGLKAIINECSKNGKVLYKLESGLYDYIKTIKETDRNREYKKEISTCYVDVLQKIDKLKYSRKGVK